MNDWDKNNLQFIMSLKPEQFDEWIDSISQDDVDYALELIKAARAELSSKAAEIFDDVEDLTEANNVLKKFTLKGE